MVGWRIFVHARTHQKLQQKVFSASNLSMAVKLLEKPHKDNITCTEDSTLPERSIIDKGDYETKAIEKIDNFMTSCIPNH